MQALQNKKVYGDWETWPRSSPSSTRAPETDTRGLNSLLIRILNFYKSYFFKLKCGPVVSCLAGILEIATLNPIKFSFVFCILKWYTIKFTHLVLRISGTFQRRRNCPVHFVKRVFNLETICWEVSASVFYTGFFVIIKQRFRFV